MVNHKPLGSTVRASFHLIDASTEYCYTQCCHQPTSRCWLASQHDNHKPIVNPHHQPSLLTWRWLAIFHWSQSIAPIIGHLESSLLTNFYSNHLHFFKPGHNQQFSTISTRCYHDWPTATLQRQPASPQQRFRGGSPHGWAMGEAGLSKLVDGLIDMF